MMATRRRGGQHGFFVLQSTVALIVAAALIMVMLLRTQQYHDVAEQVSVQQTVETIRAALGLRLTQSRGQGPAAIARIADENPFDWLSRKPDNYLGEYYSPELKQIPAGNWLFDRRDKTLIYLPKSQRSFSTDASKLLKFKVEFAQARLPGVKNGPKEVPNGLVIEEVHDQPAINTD